MNQTPSSSTPAIETIGLTKRFGERVAVDAVNLTVPPAPPSGSSATTGPGRRP